MQQTSRRQQHRRRLRRVAVPVLLSTLVAAALLPRQAAAVKLGKVTPKVWEDLESQGLSEQEMEEAAAEAAAAAAAADEEEREELRRLKAAELRREALNKAKEVDWKATADRNKKERELDEKYGALKHIVLSPWFQWLMEKIDDLLSIELIGEPRMAPVPIVMLLFMLFKSKQRTSVIALFAAFFLNLHPVLIVGAFVGVTVWARLRRPKGYDPVKPPPRTAPYVDPRHVSVNLKELGGQMGLPEEVDHIVLGSDIGGLYAAALLSRVGHSVLVLEPGDSLGNCLHTIKGVEVDYGNHTTGMLRIYDDLLRHGMAEGGPTPRWVQIGTEEDGFSYDVARVGTLQEVVYRMGKQALVDDQVTSAPDLRERVSALVTKMEAVAREASGFFISRLFVPSPLQWLLGVLLGSQGYGQAGQRTVEQVLQANLPPKPDGSGGGYEELDLLRGLFRTEGLLLSEASFAAYVSAMNHAFEGMFYPVGGLRRLAEALVPTIRAAGGKVFHRAQVKSILLEEGGGTGKKKAQRAVGVLLETGQQVRCRRSVLSALGVVPTLTHFLPKVPLGPGLEWCEEARPRFVTLVLLKGSAEELELPAQDYYQVPTPETAGSSLAWLHLSFPSAKDPDWPGAPHGCSVAVLETEADDDVLEACIRKADGSGCTTRFGPPPPGSPLLSSPPGLKFYRPRAPSDAKIRRLQQACVRRLLELFPHLQARIDTEQGIHTVGPLRAGLSHRPSRFAAPGLRAAVAHAGGTPAGVENVFLAGADLVLNSLSGALMGGWLGAHAALGYGAVDMLLLQRSLTEDLKNLRRPRAMAEGEEEHLEATPDGGYRVEGRRPKRE